MSNSANGDPWLGCNPLDPGFRDDPYPGLHRLRELDPVNQTPVGIWRLTRYDDCVRLLKETHAGVRTTSGEIPGVDPSDDSQGNFMLQQDPPAHTRLRKLVSRAFTPRAIARLEGRVKQVVEECLDRIAANGELDVIADLALPVPSTLICEMLGVPGEDRDRFTVWTAQATHGLNRMMSPPDVLQTARKASESLDAYFQQLLESRRQDLGDDILSGMIRAEEQGDRLSYNELVSQAMGLLIAGFETTIGLIGNGVRALLFHPDQFSRLREQPDRIERAVEECLRYDGPIVLTVRILHEDTQFGDKTIPKDSQVFAMLAAANRDPTVFAEPDRLDIGRSPNPHIAFGGGAHFCLGAHLARMEAKLAIGGLVARFPSLQLINETVEWGPSLFRVPGRLPVEIR